MNSLSIDDIKIYLPHRYPFLLVDRIRDFKANEYVIGIKCVSVNEPFFNGHFPQKPIMPGVLMIEAMAQTAGILVFKSADLNPDDNNVFFLAGVDSARFKQLVTPGDVLVMRVEVLKSRRGLWKFKGVATVDEKVVCEAQFLLMQGRDDA